MLVNGLSGLCLLKDWMDFDQTCTDLLLGHGQELIRFCDHDPIFKGTQSHKMLENGLSGLCLLM